MSATGILQQADQAVRDVAIVLERNGGRPLRFLGTRIACAEGGGNPAWARLRLALYECDGGGYVIELRCTPVAMHQSRAWCYAARAKTIAEALQQFETITVTPDANCGGGEDMPATARLFQAAGQMCREAAQEHALRHAIGNFLLGVAQGGAGQVVRPRPERQAVLF